MKPLLLATGNKGKILEFTSLLSQLFSCTTPDSKAPAVIEDGKTYQENAEKKARAFFEVYQTTVLSDDSGLEVDVLNGEPGIFSARYGGEKLNGPERWNYLYEKLKNYPQEKWTARFRAVLCYYDGLKDPRFFEATTEGTISSKPKGDKGFGYDPIFISIPLGKTFGEACEQEKARVSHRALAAGNFLNWAKQNLA